MKKNLGLFGLLVLVLVFTYYKEEVKISFFNSKSNQSVELMSQHEPLKRIEFKDYKVLFSDQGFITSNNLPVDQTKLDEFFRGLGYIKIKRVIESDKVKEADLNLNEKIVFKFQTEEKHYQLGEKVNFDKSFYIKFDEYKDGELTKSILAIAENTAPRFEAYDPNKKDDTVPYQTFKSLFYLPEQFFADLVMNKQVGPIASISIDSKRNRKFSINLQTYKTQPKIIDKVKPNGDEMQKIAAAISTLKGDKIFKDQNQKLEDFASIIEVESIKPFKYELYKKMDSREGYFIRFNGFIFELNPVSASIFFKNVQDFWIKRPFVNGIQSNKTLEGYVSDNKKKVKFEIPVAQSFVIESPDKLNLKRTSFQKLFLLIFGSGENDQANRVSKISKTQRKLFNSKKQFIFHFADKTLKLIKANNEVVIHDQDTDVLYYYLVNPNEEFPFDIQDFLE